MSLTIDTPHESHINIVPFAAHKEKCYPYFSYIFTIKVKHKLFSKPNSSQIFHLSIQPTIP